MTTATLPVSVRLQAARAIEMALTDEVKNAGK